MENQVLRFEHRGIIKEITVEYWVTKGSNKWSLYEPPEYDKITIINIIYRGRDVERFISDKLLDEIEAEVYKNLE